MQLSIQRRSGRHLIFLLLAGLACLLLLTPPVQAQNTITVSISGNPAPPADVGVGAPYYITVSASNNFGGLVTGVGCQSSVNSGPTQNYWENNPSNTTYFTWTFTVSNPQDCTTAYWDGYTKVFSNSSNGQYITMQIPVIFAAPITPTTLAASS
ncbi:MAG TPA: hypothetical protein VKV29_04685 [Chthonomonas sp.]|jgi:hypothetical protein|uniref:hypothetical protein n=1 Tax=Chthonomonas sp. TaxID=2282153 RepID=UPI002B4AF5F3|nr:hypothetical protein [Chthonomonas sp.]HLH79561.1 hypothetical protein [Chthonomonas sp.]